MLLSRLHTFSFSKAHLEQYQTDCEIAADLLWQAFLSGDIAGKVVADLGCGPGTLGLGAALLGAKNVFLLDLDNAALAVARENKRLLEKKTGKKLPCSFLLSDVTSFRRSVDVVLQNPPFGVQKEHADRVFLDVAFRQSQKVYSFHKLDTRPFIEAFADEHGWTCSLLKTYALPLKKTMGFHTKKKHLVHVGAWAFARLHC